MVERNWVKVLPVLRSTGTVFQVRWNFNPAISTPTQDQRLEKAQIFSKDLSGLDSLGDLLSNKIFPDGNYRCNVESSAVDAEGENLVITIKVEKMEEV